MAYPVYAGNGGIASGVGASVDVPYPGTIAADDVLIVIVGDADDDSFDIPSGWARVGSHTANGNFSSAWYWLRSPSGSESGTETFTSTKDAGQVVAGVMLRFSGCITDGDPYEAATLAGPTKSTSITISEIETLAAERLCVCLMGIEDNAGTSGGTNYAEVMDVTTDTGSDMGFSAFTYQKTPAGVVSAETATTGNDYWTSYTFALKPPAAGPTTHQLAGSVIAASVLTGAATVLHATWALAGSVAAAAVLTGSLAVGQTYPLAGSIAAAATVTGDATVSHATWDLAGSIAGASTVTGDATVTHAVWDLAGSIAATSALTGNLAISGAVALAGNIVATSTMAADLVVQHKTWALAGAIVAVSTLTGDATMAPVALAGNVEGKSLLSGFLHAMRALKGTIVAKSVVLGNLLIPGMFSQSGIGRPAIRQVTLFRR
jgi:hypothetical protein